MFLTEETSTASNKVVVVHTEVVFPNSGSLFLNYYLLNSMSAQ